MKKQKTKLVVREEVKGTPALLISQAIAKGMDLDKLEKLLVLHERYEANESRKAYHKAMAAFKADLPQIIKDKRVNYAAGGGQVRYSHASLFNVMNNLNPALSKYGLSAAWIQKQTEKEIAVTCRITHELGYSEETTLVGPADNSGAKNAIQAIGSTNSYLERYTVLALLGIATKDQDDDSQAAGKPEVQRPAALSEQKPLEKIRADFAKAQKLLGNKKFLDILGQEGFENAEQITDIATAEKILGIMGKTYKNSKLSFGTKKTFKEKESDIFPESII